MSKRRGVQLVAATAGLLGALIFGTGSAQAQTAPGGDGGPVLQAHVDADAAMAPTIVLRDGAPLLAVQVSLEASMLDAGRVRVSSSSGV